MEQFRLYTKSVLFAYSLKGGQFFKKGVKRGRFFFEKGRFFSERGRFFFERGRFFFEKG